MSATTTPSVTATTSSATTAVTRRVTSASGTPVTTTTNATDASPLSTAPLTTAPAKRTLRGAIRAEVIRLNRPTFVGVGVALLVLFTLLSASVAFFAGSDLPFGQTFDLEAADGVVAAVTGSLNIIGVVVLALWATATASDYTSGLVRLQVQAEPRRWRLLVSKIAALSALTVVGTVIVTATGIGLSYVFAGIADVSTAAWGADLLANAYGAWFDVTLAAIGYGIMGLAIATLSRSSTVAVSAGVGYLFIVEGMLANLFDLDTGYLPGGALSAVGEGGTVVHGVVQTTWTAGLLTAAAWLGVMLVASLVTVARRDVVD